MTMFIEVVLMDGRQMLLNVLHITELVPFKDGKGCRIHSTNDYYDINEPYDKLKGVLLNYGQSNA